MCNNVLAPYLAGGSLGGAPDGPGERVAPAAWGLLPRLALFALTQRGVRFNCECTQSMRNEVVLIKGLVDTKMP